MADGVVEEAAGRARRDNDDRIGRFIDRVAQRRHDAAEGRQIGHAHQPRATGSDHRGDWGRRSAACSSCTARALSIKAPAAADEAFRA